MKAVHGRFDAQQITAAELLERVGPQLCRLAGVLTDDTDYADQLVATAIVGHRVSGSTRHDLRTLCGAMYLDWSRCDRKEAPVSTSGEIRDELRALPRDQFVAIALCMYGAHSYRQAADLVGMTATDFAKSLCTALRNLDRPDLGHTLPSSAA